VPPVAAADAYECPLRDLNWDLEAVSMASKTVAKNRMPRMAGALFTRRQ
jgi:hypothetical protein